MKKLILTFVIGLMTMVGFSQTLKKGDKWYSGEELIKVDNNNKTWIGHYHTEYIINDTQYNMVSIYSIPSTWDIRNAICNSCEVVDTLKKDVISWTLAYEVRPTEYGHEKP